MINRSIPATVFAGIVTAVVLGTPALAEKSPDIAFAKEVDSCIAAVTRNLDLLEASRVRHVVTEQNRSGSAYALAIETSVFSGSEVRTYAAFCIARGANEPLKFRIDEVLD